MEHQQRGDGRDLKIEHERQKLSQQEQVRELRHLRLTQRERNK
jgi:hypothetical protein